MTMLNAAPELRGRMISAPEEYGVFWNQLALQAVEWRDQQRGESILHDNVSFHAEDDWQRPLEKLIKKVLSYSRTSMESGTDMIQVEKYPGGSLLEEQVWLLFQYLGHRKKFSRCQGVGLDVKLKLETGNYEIVVSRDQLRGRIYLRPQTRRLYFMKRYHPYINTSPIMWKDRNNPDRELLAFVLGRMIEANTAEVIVNDLGQTFSALSLTTPVATLPQKTRLGAHSTFLVLNTFLRKFDYTSDYAQRSPVGETFIEFDYDQILFIDYVKSLEQYLKIFLSHRERGKGWRKEDFDLGVIERAIIRLQSLNVDDLFSQIQERLPAGRKDLCYVDSKGRPFDYRAYCKGVLKELQLSARNDVARVYTDLLGTPLILD